MATEDKFMQTLFPINFQNKAESFAEATRQLLAEKENFNTGNKQTRPHLKNLRKSRRSFAGGDILVNKRKSRKSKEKFNYQLPFLAEHLRKNVQTKKSKTKSRRKSQIDSVKNFRKDENVSEISISTEKMTNLKIDEMLEDEIIDKTKFKSTGESGSSNKNETVNRQSSCIGDGLDKMEVLVEKEKPVAAMETRRRSRRQSLKVNEVFDGKIVDKTKLKSSNESGSLNKNETIVKRALLTGDRLDKMEALVDEKKPIAIVERPKPRRRSRRHSLKVNKVLEDEIIDKTEVKSIDEGGSLNKNETIFRKSSFIADGLDKMDVLVEEKKSVAAMGKPKPRRRSQRYSLKVYNEYKDLSGEPIGKEVVQKTKLKSSSTSEILNDDEVNVNQASLKTESLDRREDLLEVEKAIDVEVMEMSSIQLLPEEANTLEDNWNWEQIILDSEQSMVDVQTEKSSVAEFPDSCPTTNTTTQEVNLAASQDVKKLPSLFPVCINISQEIIPEAESPIADLNTEESQFNINDEIKASSITLNEMNYCSCTDESSCLKTTEVFSRRFIKLLQGCELKEEMKGMKIRFCQDTLSHLQPPSIGKEGSEKGYLKAALNISELCKELKLLNMKLISSGCMVRSIKQAGVFPGKTLLLNSLSSSDARTVDNLETKLDSLVDGLIRFSLRKMFNIPLSYSNSMIWRNAEDELEEIMTRNFLRIHPDFPGSFLHNTDQLHYFVDMALKIIKDVDQTKEKVQASMQFLSNLASKKVFRNLLTKTSTLATTLDIARSHPGLDRYSHLSLLTESQSIKELQKLKQPRLAHLENKTFNFPLLACDELPCSSCKESLEMIDAVKCENCQEPTHDKCRQKLKFKHTKKSKPTTTKCCASCAELIASTKTVLK